MGANVQTLYNSSGMPIGTRKIYLYRQNNPGINPATALAGAPAFTAGAATAGNAVNGCTLLGLYLLEVFNDQATGKALERMDNIGADLDFSLLRERDKGNATIQLATGLTALPLVGDFFEISIGYEQDNATPLPYMRFVISNRTKDENDGTPQKVTASLMLDRNNSDPFWSS
jgi:hypothetical protein